MFQTVGHEVMESIADCMQLPLRRSRVGRGQAKEQCLSYAANPPEDDEVEEMYRLLEAVKQEFPEVEGVTTGAILSDYQRNRVERVCTRLGLVSLAYLWQRPGGEVLDMVTELGVRAVIVKTASAGLAPRALLGKTLEEVRPVLEHLERQFHSHMAGEGGEFETIVLDCPLYKEAALAVKHMDIVMVDVNDYAPSGHCVLDVEQVPKSEARKREDAAILARLMDRSPNGFHFPSDTMAALPSGEPPLPLIDGDSVQQETPVAVAVSVYHAVVPVVENGGTNFPMETFRRTSDDGVEKVFEDVKAWTESYKHVPLAIFVTCDEKLTARLRTAYDSTAPVVNPPVLSWTTQAGYAGCTVSVMVEPQTPQTDSDTLHAQSLSCWAAGLPGATFSQAFSCSTTCLDRFTAAMGEVTVRGCCGVRGEDPTTGLLVGRTEDDADKAFTAQFAHAYANAMGYFTVLGLPTLLNDPPGSALVAVCCVTRESDIAKVLPLWRWCTGETGESAAEDRDRSLTCVVVPALQHNALVELTLFHSERGQSYDDDDDSDW